MFYGFDSEAECSVPARLLPRPLHFNFIKDSYVSDVSESQVPPKADYLAFYVPSNNFFPLAKCFNEVLNLDLDKNIV